VLCFSVVEVLMSEPVLVSEIEVEAGTPPRRIGRPAAR
jgi:hypothetical protein